MTNEEWNEKCDLLQAEIDVLLKENLSSRRKIEELEKEIGRLTSLFLKLKIAK